MIINWYPGHMAKTRRLMLGDLKQIDLICELLDARIPIASRNPDLERMSADKRRLIILNRADQADRNQTEAWKKYYESRGFPTIILDSKSGDGFNGFLPLVRKIMADMLARNEEKGMLGRNVRIMACGIPNVGKSSFINRILGKKSAIAADKPGVTRKNQWFSLKGNIDLMDTPGMLWPKIEDEHTGLMLAFTGTINDEILDVEELACNLITTLEKVAPGAIASRYGVSEIDITQPYDALIALAKARGYLLSRGEFNTERMARGLIDEFRIGKLGNITLERAPKAGDS